MMVKVNIVADLSTFNALLEIFVEKGDVDTCFGLFNTMRETRLATADARTYAWLIEACLRHSSSISSSSSPPNSSSSSEEEEEEKEKALYLSRAQDLMEEAIQQNLLQDSKELWEAR